MTQTPIPEVPQRSVVMSGVKSVFGLGFGAVRGVFGRFTARPRFKVEETVVYSVHQSFFLWPLIFAGFFVSLIVRHFPAHAEGWTWAWIWLVFYTFIMVFFDLSTIKMIMWTGIFALVFMTSKWFQDVRHISILGHLFSHFHNLHPVISGGVASVLSWLLFGPWVVALVETARCGRKSFSPNGIEERRIGEGREITDRSGLHFVAQYRDLLETLSGFGAGDIVATDGTGKVIKRWENIVGLFFYWGRLDEILHQRSAVVDNSQTDPVEAEIVK